MTLLIIGASGHLGGELCRQAVAAGHRAVGAYYRAPTEVPGVAWRQLDVRDPAAVDELVQRVRPTAIVNAAYAYQDWATCADGAGHVAVAAVRAGVRLVHISSDAIHGGRPAPYRDDDPPSPVFAYGAAKAAGETAVRVTDPAAVIVRTSLLLGDADSSQIRLCLEALAGRAALFADEVRCPIAVEDVAAAVLELVESTVAGPLNVAGPEAVSRVELGRLVAIRYGLDPTTLTESTTTAAGLVRPTEVRLDITRARSVLRTPLRPASAYLAASVG